nr:hypothetical protein [Larkinella soli]
MAFILLAEPLSGEGVGLTGETPANKVNCAPVGLAVEGLDVAVAFCIGKVFSQHLAAPFIDFNLHHRLPPHPFGGKVKSSNTCE